MSAGGGDWTVIGIETLAKLIAALPPAPAHWVRKAQQLPAQTPASTDRKRQVTIDAHGSATLTNEIAVERAITTLVTRQQVLDALNCEQGTTELRLELVQASPDGQHERAAISLSWSKQDLERLLERATTEQVVLTFDREQLAQPFAEVEAHALPEQAFSVAVAPAYGPRDDGNADGGALAITAAAFSIRRSLPPRPS